MLAEHLFCEPLPHDCLSSSLRSARSSVSMCLPQAPLAVPGFVAFWCSGKVDVLRFNWLVSVRWQPEHWKHH
eukprot:6473709-Amphidinium_carterae.1